jgi:hypothetical protein
VEVEWGGAREERRREKGERAGSGEDEYTRESGGAAGV